MDELKCPILSHMVQLGLPVVAVVQDLITGGRLSTYSNLVRLSELKCCAACHNMNMRRDLSWEDDRVTTLNGQREAVDRELSCSNAEQSEGCKDLSHGFVRHDASWKKGVLLEAPKQEMV